MTLPSAYKANHQNNFRFDPIQTKHTSIMDGLMKIYGTWKAIPADIRYSITGSDRDLNEAIADGSMNAAGEDVTEVGSFRKWQEKNPDGTYEDYAKYKKTQELADFKDKWNIVNGKGEEKTTETTTTTDANGKTEGTTTETTKEEGEAPKEETYEWETSKGLPVDDADVLAEADDENLPTYYSDPEAEAEFKSNEYDVYGGQSMDDVYGGQSMDDSLKMMANTPETAMPTERSVDDWLQLLQDKDDDEDWARWDEEQAMKDGAVKG